MLGADFFMSVPSQPLVSFLLGIDKSNHKSKGNDMKFENIAQPWQQQQQASVVIPTRSNNRFFYKHHPKNWALYYFDVMNTKTKKKEKRYKQI